MLRCIIYGLYSSDSDMKIRYIGQTKKSLHKRLITHLWLANQKPHRPVSNWINKHVSLGHSIRIAPICIGTRNETERLCITTARRNGWDLMNVTDGGDGGATCKGRVWTEEERAALRKPKPLGFGAAISAAKKGQFSERARQAIARLAEAKKGLPLSEQAKAKLRAFWAVQQNRDRMSAAKTGCAGSFTGKKHSAETKKRIGVLNKARRVSPETRMRMSISATKSWERRHSLLSETDKEDQC